MITVQGEATWTDGHADGIIRDTRQPVPQDGLLSGAVLVMGDEVCGPALVMTIEKRLFPRKAPVHLHKTDTFRMALNDPIVVGRTSYPHGGFRLQAADSYYGPEYWTDEVGTNQVLIMADRRGVKPYLLDEPQYAAIQAAIDHEVETSDDLLSVSEPLPRDAVVEQAIGNNFGATLHAGHWDGSFDDSATWPSLADGSRVALIAFGHPANGPMLLGLDRPAGAPSLPGFDIRTDIVRLVVDGSAIVGEREMGRLAFRLEQSGSHHDGSRPGTTGCKELWVVADRNAVPAGVDDELIDQWRSFVGSA